MLDSGINTLIKWGQSHGAVLDSSIKFEKTENRGVCAFSTKNITSTPSTPQIKIPLDIILRKELSDSYFGKGKFNDADNVNSALKLLVAKLKFDSESTIVQEEDLKAKFAPFIDLLPVGRDTGSVFYWTSEEFSLLENTNLGGSLDAKIDNILKEWYSTVKLLDKTPQSEQDLTLMEEYKTLSRDELVARALDVRSWTSFGAYLWSSIIFTSRAFPHDLIDAECEPGQAILLPILDLLNHDNSAKVQWKFDADGFFSLTNMDIIQEGDEVFNNYGAKGNEELLMGYGFAIEKNKADSIALKVKLPTPVVKSAVEVFGFKIPKIEDYTQFAFNNDSRPSSEATDDDIEDGMIFFINYHNLVPDNLLLLFMFLAKSGFESHPTLRSKLEALQTLRSALERKQALLKQSIKLPEDIDPSISQHAKFYRDGQKDLYKASLVEIKHIEKQLLQDHKGQLTNLKKIFKRDEALQDIVEKAFGLETYEQILAEDVADNVLFLWVILHGSLDIENSVAPKYIIKSFKGKLSNTFQDDHIEAFSALADYLAGELQGHEIQSHVTTKNLVIATEVLKENSYTRISSDEIIIVDPLEI